jgi:hypothetical protein
MALRHVLVGCALLVHPAAAAPSEPDPPEAPLPVGATWFCYHTTVEPTAGDRAVGCRRTEAECRQEAGMMSRLTPAKVESCQPTPVAAVATYYDERWEAWKFTASPTPADCDQSRRELSVMQGLSRISTCRTVGVVRTSFDEGLVPEGAGWRCGADRCGRSTKACLTTAACQALPTAYALVTEAHTLEVFPERARCEAASLAQPAASLCQAVGDKRRPALPSPCDGYLDALAAIARCDPRLGMHLVADKFIADWRAAGTDARAKLAVSCVSGARAVRANLKLACASAPPPAAPPP